MLSDKDKQLFTVYAGMVRDLQRKPTLEEFARATGRASVGSMQKVVKRFECAGLIAPGSRARDVELPGVCKCCGQAWNPASTSNAAEAAHVD